MVFAGTAKADETYKLDLKRTQGDVTCTINTANGGSADCQSNVTEEEHLSIEMKSFGGNKGYAGVDKLKESNGTFVLAVIARPDKSVKDVVLMHGQPVNQGFDGTMSVAGTSTPEAFFADPMHVEHIDQQTLKVQLSFVSYAPASGSAPVDKAMERDSIADLCDCSLRFQRKPGLYFSNPGS